MGADDDTKAIAEAKKKAGNEAFAKKDYDEALRLYSEAIDLDASNYIYHSNRSACYALKGDHAKAKQEAETCIRLNPSFIKGYYRLATAQSDLGDTVAALATVDVGLGKEPKSGDLLRLKRMLRTKKAAAASLAQRGVGGSSSKGAAGSGGEGGRVDPQTIQEFQELSEQVGKTKRELAEVEAQLQSCVREQKRGTLTKDELERVDDGTTMYQTIGKMFMLKSRSDITRMLDKQQAERSKSETQLQAKQSYLQSRLTSEQGNLEEIIKNIHAQGSA